MPDPTRTVLITGCSDGGLGSALAIAFHNAGLHVYATARNPSKMANLSSLGIETLTLDVLSSTSIAACVAQLAPTGLDMLVNNAGASYTMPISDLSIPDAKKLFDLNVWSQLEVIQAFLPMLLESKAKPPMIVNQTSVTSVSTLPFLGAYGASKAAMAMFSNTLRLELQCFGIAVVELKTAAVKSHLIHNHVDIKPKLPENSIYSPAKEVLEKALRQDQFADGRMDTEAWAKAVVGDLLGSKNPKPVIWRGEQAMLAWIASLFPSWMFEGTLKGLTGLDGVEKAMKGEAGK